MPVLIDTTPPDAGWVHDGLSALDDIQYTSSSASKSCTWDNFKDAESGIGRYEASLHVNGELRKTFDVAKETKTLTDHTVTMEHMDVMHWQLSAFNGAKVETEVVTDGFLVDHTAPEIEYILDNNVDKRYQRNSSTLDISWKATDPESGIRNHAFYIQELKHGSKTRFWPDDTQFNEVYENTGVMAFALQDLDLVNGAMYTVQVIITNNALLSTHHESIGVIIDTTAPTITEVSLKHRDQVI